MLQIENINKSFGKFKALDKIDFLLDKGDSIALLGPNGSGKTTLIKSILGLVAPDSGLIKYQGKVLESNELKKKIGYMPQTGRYPENMKVGALFNMMLAIRNKELNSCDDELYRQFNIKEIENKGLGTLSGGTLQKVGAVLAFLFKPEILILDEPTAGLDPISSTILKAKIKAFKEEEKVVIITSHIISELDDLVDKVMYLIEGKLHFYKPVTTIKQETKQPLLERALADLLHLGFNKIIANANS